MLRTRSDSEYEEAFEGLAWLSEPKDLNHHLEELESLPCQFWARAIAVVDRPVGVYWSGMK